MWPYENCYLNTTLKNNNQIVHLHFSFNLISFWILYWILYKLISTIFNRDKTVTMCFYVTTSKNWLSWTTTLLCSVDIKSFEKTSNISVNKSHLQFVKIHNYWCHKNTCLHIHTHSSCNANAGIELITKKICRLFLKYIKNGQLLHMKRHSFENGLL